MINALEIDFLPVGESSKSGDAIAMRFGYYDGAQWQSQYVIIIDGGNISSGEALVKHVREVYKTNVVNRVILTHPDGDHASGLRTVVQELDVKGILMHRPWMHWKDVEHSIVDGRITRASFGERLKNAYQYAYEVEQIAIRKHIPIEQPRQGKSLTVGDETMLTILGPGKDFYLSLLQSSDKTPSMDVDEGIEKAFTELKKKTAFEDMSFETEHLSENDEETSAENDMSLVVYLTLANQKILLTGDAGTMGLYKAIRYALEKNIDLKQLTRFQVPHHGSRHNISKGILEHIHAPYAFISCAVDGAPSHPSKIVTNALHRRGIQTFQTKGNLLTFHTSNVPIRQGMEPAKTIPFYSIVEIPLDEKTSNFSFLNSNKLSDYFKI